MSKKTRKPVKKVARRSPLADQDITITERLDNGRLETAIYSVGELDELLDETAEGGGWSPSYNRLQHAVLTAWTAVREARSNVSVVVLRFPKESE